MIVIASVTEQQHRRFRTDVLAVALPKHFERMAIIGVPIDPHHVGLGVDAMNRLGDVFSGLEVIGDFIDAIDEHERSHL